MELFISALDWLRTGLLGLIGGAVALVVLAALFGKRVEKKWDFEADFRDTRGREVGEFEAELRRIVEEGSDFELRVKLVLRHPALVPGASVRVSLAGEPVLEGPVEVAGRIRLGNQHLVGDLKEPETDQLCVVECGDVELFAEPIRPD